MEKVNTDNKAQAVKQEQPVLVVVIHDCAFETYWYKDWYGHHINVIEFADHFVVHTDYIDGQTPYRMIDKGDATIVGRLTMNADEKLIFSERLAHNPKEELGTLLGKKMASAVDQMGEQERWKQNMKNAEESIKTPHVDSQSGTAKEADQQAVYQYISDRLDDIIARLEKEKQRAFFVPGERMDHDLITDARRNVEDLDTDVEIAKALADIYGMRTALQAVMMWFNKDHVSTPQYLYELVANRINKSTAYGITNEAAALYYLGRWKEDFPNWEQQQKLNELEHTNGKTEHEMLLRLGDYVMGNFGEERNYEKQNVVSFVIELLMELQGRRTAMKPQEEKESKEQWDRIHKKIEGDHTSDAFRYAAHEFTSNKLTGYEALMTFLEKEFPNEGKGDTASTVAMKLLLQLKEYRNSSVINGTTRENSDKWTNIRDYIILNWKVKSEDITFEYVRDMLASLLNYQKINKLQGMPVAPLLKLNDQLVQFINKEFPNDPGGAGKDEAPIEVAIRLLTEYAQGWNVAEGLLHFMGWFTNLEHPFEFGTRHSPFNMVPLIESFINAHKLPRWRRTPAFYLNPYKEQKA